MSGLLMKLAPFERFYVNGALIENGSRRGQIHVLQMDAFVLRESAYLQADMVRTDLERTCMVAQNALLGLIDRDQAARRVHRDVGRLLEKADPGIASLLLQANDSLADSDLRNAYLVLMRALKAERACLSG